MLQAQTKEVAVKGVVKDNMQQLLPGASIFVEGIPSKGTVTDDKGEFTINVPVGKTLIVSFVGFNDSKYIINESVTFLDITLTEDSQMLSTAVVFGYGKVEKKDLTGSIQTLDNKELMKSMATDVTEALTGRVGGVLVNKSSNRPGADMKIQIRGNNSLTSASEPLFVIDGVPSYSGMRHLNSADIESIDILRDASSAAIYGSRGANGVVIITTKGANKKEGFNVEYTGFVGLKTPTRIPDMIGNKGNGLEYVDYRIALWKKKYGESSLSRPDFLTADEKRRIKHGEYYDWLREVSNNALVTTHSVSASGNTEKVSYTFGLGYLKDNGMVGNEGFQRITTNVGLEYRASERFKLGLSNYISLNNINHGANDALINAYFLPPIVSPYDKDGNYLFNAQPTSSKINPFVQIENNKKETEARYTNFSGFLEFKPINNLTAKSQLAVQYDNDVYGEWTGTLTQAKQGVDDPEAFRREGVNINYVWDNILTYDAKFNKIHKLNVVGVFSMQKETHKGSQMRGVGLPYESNWHAIQTADQITDVSSYYWESSMLSYVGRVSYILKDRYLFTASGRYDGLSRLAKGNQWGFMPSFAIGWRINQESFLNDVSWINDLKLRASWGKTGNSNLGYDITYSKLDMHRYPFGENGENGFGIGNTKGNKDLKWEMMTEWNYGLDFSLFGNRVSGTVDIYSRLTDNLIMPRSVASLNGYTNIYENIGSVSNKGFEIGLNTTNISNQNFTWKTSTTFSLNRNKIVDLYGNKQDDLANRWFIGQPVSVIYDFVRLGIWQEEQKPEAAKYGQVPGHVHVKDIDDNGVLDERDYKVVGTPSPDWIAGMTNTFTYKNWDLSFYMYARFGGLYDDQFTYMFTAWDNEHWNKLDVNYWTPQNRSNDYPEVGAQSYYTQVLGKVSGTFLKVQNITLGYKLPGDLLKKAGIKSARVYGSVQNPFTFTKYKGPDPEIIGEDVNTQLSLYPMIFMLGVNISF